MTVWSHEYLHGKTVVSDDDRVVFYVANHARSGDHVADELLQIIGESRVATLEGMLSERDLRLGEVTPCNDGRAYRLVLLANA